MAYLIADVVYIPEVTREDVMALNSILEVLKPVFNHIRDSSYDTTLLERPVAATLKIRMST